MKLYVALLISALIVGCEPATKPTEKIEKKPEPKTPANENQISAPAKPLLDFSYSYPKNLYTRKDAGMTDFGTEIEAGLYPIGFSKNGLFAYLERPCHNGCGCCTHNIIVQDIFTDKTKGSLSINPRNEPLGYEAELNHVSDWNKFIKPLSNFLRSHNISQFDLELKRDRTFFRDGHGYEVKSTVRQTPIEDRDLNLVNLRYNIKVVMDNQHAVTVASGEVVNASEFEYKGYIESPLTNQVILIFDQRTFGFEGSIDFSIIPVGVTLDPKLFYR